MANSNKSNHPHLEKVEWNQISETFKALNPELGQIIDEISPDKSFGLYKCRYPYGEKILSSGVFQVPDNNGSTIPITHQNTPKDIKQDLSYNSNANPVSMILKNSSELFLTQNNHSLSLYGLITPGKIFSTWIVLNSSKITHAPPFFWDMTAGARSFFMLSKLYNQSGYARLRKAFSLSCDKPKFLFEHWKIFKEIAQDRAFTQPWETEILFFGKKWFDQLHDPKFIFFKNYLLDKAWQSSDYVRNQFIWNYIYSTIQRKNSIKTDPYLAETVKHLFGMASGSMSGFAPSIDNLAAPVDGLRRAYNDVYQLNEYQPVFMEPHILSSSGETRPVYYSLEYPSTMEFSSRNRDDKNKIQDLILIKSLINKYLLEMSNNHLNIENTPIGSLHKNIEFNYYHTTEGYHLIDNSHLIPEQDKNFTFLNGNDDRPLPIHSPFLRGCIKITRKIQSS
jgi:hypothetical protein